MITKNNQEEQGPGEKIVSSGVIIFRKSEEGPRFLMLYYGHNYWTFPRGKIEKGENGFSAALRETKEETGLSKSDLMLSSYFKAHERWIFVRNNRKIFRVIIFYLAQTHQSNIKISSEHKGYGWFTYHEAIKILVGEKNSENRKVLKRAYDFINKNSNKKTAE
ncbi:MAG: NUDIX domain-containing protein [Candidatus Paceibacterota bacterium]|jgi:8-oxo-dGTP pyrophosphatase MutT (NUDIX family)